MAYSSPRTWTTAELVTAAMLNQEIRDNLLAAFPLAIGAWTSYTPTLTQSGAVSKTVTYAKYQRVGRTIYVTVLLTVTGTGTAANGITISLPVTAASGGFAAVGAGFVNDASLSVNHAGVVALSTTTVVTLVPTSTSAGANMLGQQGFTAALAAGDLVTFSATYEAAT